MIGQIDKWIEKYKNVSLQFKVMSLFFVFTVLLTLIIGALFYNQITETVRANKEREITTLANETANKIERFLFEREADIQVISQSHILVLDEVSLEDKEAYLQYVVDYYQTYDEIVVYDATSVPLFGAFSNDMTRVLEQSQGHVADFSGTIENILMGDKALEQAIFSQTQYVSDIIDSESILFSRALYDRTGEYRGVVIEKMNFHAIDDILKSVNVGTRGKARLISEVLPVGIQYEQQEDARYVVCNVPIVKYKTQQNQWYLSIREPVEEAFAILGSIKVYFALVFIVTMAVLMVFSYGLSNRITKPIRLLKQRTALLLASHKLEDSKTYGVTDEVKALTHTFDFLLEELVFMLQKTLEKSGEIESVKRIKDSIDVMIEHTSTGMITLDGHGNIKSINQRALELLGITEHEDIVGKRLKLTYHQILIKAIEDSLEEGVPIEDFKCENRWVSTLIQRDIYQNVVGMTVLIQSIEARERFESSVHRAKKLSELGELSVGVAHEIRNPLASVRGYTQLAIKTLPEDSCVISDLQIVLDEVDRLDRLIDRFMNFAKPNLPVLKRHDMNKTIHEVVLLLEQRLKSEEINLDLDLVNDAVFTFDEDQMKQVMYNLILNGIQASKAGDRMEIKSYIDYAREIYQLKIKDFGEGIPTEIKERVFSPFFTTRAKGTGLGLSICARIVENHQGTLVLNTSSANGTEFTVELPIEGGVM